MFIDRSYNVNIINNDKISSHSSINSNNSNTSYSNISNNIYNSIILVMLILIVMYAPPDVEVLQDEVALAVEVGVHLCEAHQFA